MSKILQYSRDNGGESYVKRFNGWIHLVVMLYAVIMRFDSLREITASLLAETRNCTSEFSVKIDLASLTVKLLESRKDTGMRYPGMEDPMPYISASTLSGTLRYTEAYN